MSSPLAIEIARPQTIAGALTTLGTRSGVIELTDNGRYTEAVAVKLAKEQRVEIRARNGVRPFVNGAISVEGGTDSELNINGILIDAAVTVPKTNNHLAHLRIRHCTLVPHNTPSRHHCEPDTEIAANGDAAAVIKWLRPSFVSTRYGDPGYALLKVNAPVQIRTGAEDGAEMGAFHMVQAARREANLRAALDEYLRLGLEAGIFYAS